MVMMRMEMEMMELMKEEMRSDGEERDQVASKTLLQSSRLLAALI